MDKGIIIHLQKLAFKYETIDFIPQDPISFPYHYKEKKDIEIAAFIAQWLAYGKRELFLKVLNSLYEEINDSPYAYIVNRGFEKFKSDSSCMYRFYKKKDFYSLCESLHNIYAVEGKGEMSMEEVLHKHLKNNKTIDCLIVIQTIQKFFLDVKGIPKDTKSSCKRLCMFLRWMVRKNSPVDFGIWNLISPQQLIIPLDVHVFRQSKNLYLTKRNDTSIKTALEITSNLKKVFPFDPTKVDFALFSLGVNSIDK
ncbi:MAG: TIGR02757 family protein [Bacteroidales bacterium]